MLLEYIETNLIHHITHPHITQRFMMCIPNLKKYKFVILNLDTDIFIFNAYLGNTLWDLPILPIAVR